MKIRDLTEARRNPNHPAQKKTSVVDQLMKYNGDDSIFISFTELEKIGINPRSTYATPNGIYCYKLNDYIEEIFDQGITMAIPYAYDVPYINVLKQTKPLLDIATYSKQDLENDIVKLSKVYGIEDDILLKSLSQVSYKTNYKYLNFIMTKIISNVGLDDEFYGTHKSSMLRKLGYYGLYDGGLGAIHSAEPKQAVFFTNDSYKLIERIKNKVDARDVKIDPSVVFKISTSKANIRLAYNKNKSIFIDLLDGPNKNNIPTDVVLDWINEVGIPTAKIHLKNTKYERLLHENK